MSSGAYYSSSWPSDERPISELDGFSVYATEVLSGPDASIIVRDYAQIIRIDPSAGTFRRLVGSAGGFEYTPDLSAWDVIGQSASASEVAIGWSLGRSMAIDPQGRLVFAVGGPYLNGRNGIFRVALDGSVEHIAGVLEGGSDADGGLATEAVLSIDQLYVDPTGVIWLLTDGFTRLRRIGLDGIVSTVLEGTPVYDEGGALLATDPAGHDVTSDAAGNLYVLSSGSVYDPISDTSNGFTRVTRIDAVTLTATPIPVAADACQPSSTYVASSASVVGDVIRFVSSPWDVVGDPEWSDCRIDLATGTASSTSLGLTGRDIRSNIERSTDGSLWWTEYDVVDDQAFGGLMRLEAGTDPQTGTVSVGVVTSPPGGSGSVAFTGAVEATLGSGAQTDPASVPAGQVVVSATPSTGWAIAGVVCDDTDSSGSTEGTVTFDVAPGEDVFCAVVIGETAADVAVTKTVDQATVVSGGTLTYTLTAINHGPGVATDVRLVDFLPAGVTFGSAGAGCAVSGSEVECAVGDLAAGEAVSRTVTVIAGAVASVENSAAVASTSSDPVLDNNTVVGVATTILPADVNICQAGTGNEIWAFGWNGYGSAGLLAPGNAVTPMPLNRLDDVVDIEGSNVVTTFALRGDGVVCSWGFALYGALGRPTGSTGGVTCAFCTPVPAPVRTSTGILDDGIRIAGRLQGYGGFAIVDVDADGAGVLYGWGSNTARVLQIGSAGGGGSSSVAVPIAMPGGREVIDVASGGYGGEMVAALTDDRRVFVWGRDDFDQLQLGPGEQTGQPPADITDRFPFVDGEQPARVLTETNGIMVVLTDQGRAYHWGAGLPPRLAFTAPGTIVDIQSTDGGGGGGGVVMLIDDDGDGLGDVYTWRGVAGDGTAILAGVGDAPRRAALPEPARAIAAGETHTLAIGQSGDLWGWGSGGQGELDNGGFDGTVLVPIRVGGVSAATRVWAARNKSFVIGDPSDVAPSVEALFFPIPVAGGTGGTDAEADGATATDRVETTVTSSSGATVIVTESPLDPTIASQANGFQAWDQMVSLWAYSSVSGVTPQFTVSFELYLSPVERAAEEAFGTFVSAIQLFRNGEPVPDCAETAPPYSPDPCVLDRTYDPTTGNAVLRIATTQFSTWTFAVPAPVVDAGGPYEVVEGGSIAMEGSVSSTVPATVRWVVAEGLVDDVTDPTAVFEAVQDGEFELALEVSAAGIRARDTAAITVSNAPPTIESVVVDPTSLAPGATTSLDVTFTDPGRFDIHDVTVDWGDGTSNTFVQSLEPGGATVTATHVFAEAGTYAVTTIVADDDGGTDTATSTVVVAPSPDYDFEGFYAPVDARPAYNQMRAGRAVPIRFSLGGDFGLDVLATGSPSSRAISCTTGAPIDEVEVTMTAGASSLSYDPATDRYSYVWKTEATWAGQCREFVLTLDDGSQHVALFRFR